jgi:RNA-directed DNA polymerase
VADPRNLFLAYETLSRQGGRAPGPDGLRYHDLAKSEVWSWARAAGEAILDGGYRPGPERQVQIPKSSGKGTRTLKLVSILDRAVSRAITQVLQPFLDPVLTASCLGYRPGRNTWHALALAEKEARDKGLLVWLCEDVKDAFDQVPQRRLLDVLRTHVPDERMMHLLEAVIVTPQGRGVPQGGCLSPLLLNVYLHHHLDRVWRRRHPGKPLVRVADDLLVLCDTRQEADEARDRLVSLLTPAAMPLKGRMETAVRDLALGQEAAWLGYTIRAQEGRLRFSVAEKAWSHLHANLAEAQLEPLAPLLVRDVVQGWVSYLGPCYGKDLVSGAYARVRSTALATGHEELPSARTFTDWWSASHARWEKLRRREDGEDRDNRGRSSIAYTGLAAPPAAPPLDGDSESRQGTTPTDGPLVMA